MGAPAVALSPRENAEYQAMMDEKFPRSQYPYDCSLDGCRARVTSKWDTVWRGEKHHFCCLDHLYKFMNPDYVTPTKGSRKKGS